VVGVRGRPIDLVVRVMKAWCVRGRGRRCRRSPPAPP